MRPLKSLADGGRYKFTMGIELTSDEITKVIARVRMAKIHGFATVTLKVSEYRIASLKIELDTPREEINNLYKNHLTVLGGTSSICG